ncbi:MAG: NADH-quinone oxidoreductase subunit NuoE [Dehalococcoidia bacterium]|nr:MAG: NADH-quinone oxidoreductase subunit NuoE [Dehalococcoidia bacterium]
MEVGAVLDKVDSIIDSYKGEEELLISLLQDIQAECNYLPREALIKVSERLDVSLSQVFSVATFFKAFSLKPRGRHIINVCLGTACHVRGGKGILAKIERDLGIEAGEPTQDLRFTLETVRCVGCCSLAPVMVIDEETHGRLSQEKVPRILENYR